jgi:signal peptidase I
VVAPGSVFVMGDNRDNSTDSRVLGAVPLHLIKGRALVVWWSRWHRLLGVVR